ncbi:PTS transporter subunit EIIC [Nocardioides mesophilus]|uniref:PTS transporter subunit EIIC n=1 Tax=Nocardioides mesophilus TaxID=433659 RepID=A0A7G9RF18_9ACTN|nr:PTS transporter subunit EIIC [Nocardioides mesophilus]
MGTDQPVAAAGAGARDRPGLDVLQRLGRSLMLPIAALPVAALLLRLGQPDMLGAGESGLALASRWPWLEPVATVLAAAGGALFSNLALLFAVGVAVGFARRSDGSTAVAAVVGYLTFDAVTTAMSPYVLDPATASSSVIDYEVFGGIVIGLVSAVLWERYRRIELPTYLAFFGGRRFVPIITALASLLVGVLMAFLYPAFDRGLTALGEWLVGNHVLGAGVYGFANRMLVPFGLHHLINSVPWFVVGSYETAGGDVVRGDVTRFLSGDPSAGAYMTGFFPIMMFALPAAALAIYHEAAPARRRLVKGVMLSGALTSFLTGITEPLEFAFMFVAWPLFVLHAVLTGTALALVNALGIKDGFAFSAGAIDYALNFTAATRPLLLIPVGLGYAALYYLLFRVAIRRLDLRTPGRERSRDESEASR